MPVRNRTVVGFGNSITLAGEVPEDQKWLNVLGQMARNRDPQTEWTLINAGVGGNTSREGLARFQKDVLDHRPEMVLIEFGGNDATKEEGRHVSLNEFEVNLHTILDGVRNVSAKAVMVVFPPVINEWHCWGKDPFYQQWGGIDGCVEEYRNITRRLAQEEKLPLADIDVALRTACRRDGPEKFIRPCGVHLTEAGNQVVAETVFRVFPFSSLM